MGRAGVDQPIAAWLRARPYWTQVAIVALTYYVAGELGLRLSLVGQSVTPLWPPTGVAIVALLALGSRTWPAVTIAAVAINVPLGPTLWAALLIAVGNTAAPLAAVALLKAAQFRIDLARVRDAAALVLLGALAAMAISATVGTLALLWAGAIQAHHFAGAWSVWWTGDAMGVLIVAPFLWSVAHHPEHQKRHPSWEVIAAASALFVVCGIVMAADLPLWFLIVPVLGVIAWRFGQRGAARADLVVSVIATIVAARELGVFDGMTLAGRMITLQSFNATVVFTSLLLAAAVSQRADLAAVQRDAVETLQRSLLPERLCEVPGLELAARYIPANDQVELGGDWYDVISLHDGRFGVVIGDVAGHGILAAAIMGKIRTALRAFASDGSSPGTALERLNSLLSDLQEGATATVWYGQYEPSSRLLVFANAGHVPPLVVDAHGAQYLEDVHGPPVGAFDRTTFGESCCALEPGTTLFLYTDGLIERRKSGLDDGLARLRASMPSNDVDPEQTCDAVVRSLAAGSSDDDIAVLAVRVRADRRDLHIVRRATAASVPETRHLVEAWLAENGIGGSEAFDVLLATTEACGNVVTHAYGLTPGLVEVTGRLTPSHVRIVVSDDGVWCSETRSQDGGRGLTIMRSFMDRVEIVTTPRTEIRMERRVSGALHE